MTFLTHATGADVEAAIHRRLAYSRILNQDPLVCYMDAFLSVEEAAELIALAKDRMMRAVVSGAKRGIKSNGRTNSVAWLAHTTSPLTRNILRRVSVTVGLPVSHAESFQVIRYLEGDEYRAHFDAFDPTTERGLRNMRRGGQRITSTLCYLNQVKAGGATGFTKLGFEVAPKPGRLLVFNNCHGDQITRSPSALHSGNPVTSGEKWAFNLWFREYPVRYDPVGEMQAIKFAKRA